nr:hypothetical protein [Pseudomonas sp. BIGb0427]
MEFRLGRVALLEAREEIFDRFDHVDIHQMELDLCFSSTLPRSHGTATGRNVVFMKLNGAFV